jgi:uncharacterized membrane protein
MHPGWQPYAPPAAYGAPVAAAPSDAPGRSLPWEIGEVLSGAWNVFQRHWAPLCVGILIVGVAVGIPILIFYVGAVFAVIAAINGGGGGSGGGLGAPELALVAGVATPLVAALFLIPPIFLGRLIRMSITALRGGTPEVGDLFRGETRYGPMLGLLFLQSMCIYLGYLLLIVPGVILSVGLHFSAHLVVDRRLGAVEAMKASWRLTRGHKGQVFLLVLVLGLVAAVCGFIPFVGHFIGYCLMLLSLSIVYLRRMGEAVPVVPPPVAPARAYGGPWQAPTASPYVAPHGGGYGPPPPGGYGPGGGYAPPGPR